MYSSDGLPPLAVKTQLYLKDVVHVSLLALAAPRPPTGVDPAGLCSARGPWKCFSSDFPLKPMSSLNRSIISLGEWSVWTFPPHSAAFVEAVLPVG